MEVSQKSHVPRITSEKSQGAATQLGRIRSKSNVVAIPQDAASPSSKNLPNVPSGSRLGSTKSSKYKRGGGVTGRKRALFKMVFFFGLGAIILSFLLLLFIETSLTRVASGEHSRFTQRLLKRTSGIVSFGVRQSGYHIRGVTRTGSDASRYLSFGRRNFAEVVEDSYRNVGALRARMEPQKPGFGLAAGGVGEQGGGWRVGEGDGGLETTERGKLPLPPVWSSTRQHVAVVGDRITTNTNEQ